jgi:hypothetical protein
MFQTRRLVLGGVGGLTDISFVDSLVDLSRNSPRVYDDNFTAGTSKYHVGVKKDNVEIRKEPLLADLREVWPDIDSLLYVEGADEKNKEHAHAILQRVKKQFFFYRATCPINECGTDGPKKPTTTMLGIVACDPAVGGLCQYAEARRCESLSCGNRWAEFNRFHGLTKLLEVKQGRCSELSRVAYGMYLALGYDARMAIDFTDHVWTEVRLPRGPEGKWYHGDPSEGVFDRPIMYEKGWGKKLTFIFGVTPTSIEDISERYTADYPAMIARRGVDDKMLAFQLQKANYRLTYTRGLSAWGYSDAGSVIENVAFMSHFM